MTEPQRILAPFAEAASAELLDDPPAGPARATATADGGSLGIGANRR